MCLALNRGVIFFWLTLCHRLAGFKSSVCIKKFLGKELRMCSDFHDPPGDISFLTDYYQSANLRCVLGRRTSRPSSLFSPQASSYSGSTQVRTRSEIFHTFQCTGLTKLIMALWLHIPPLSWSQENCVIHSFTTMCHNLLVKVAKVV